MITAEPAIPVDGATPHPKDYRWNAAAIITDMGSFNTGMNFISTTAVLPGLIIALGGSEIHVGLASGLISGSWLLPQLLIAGIVARLPRKQPFMARAAWITRPILVVLALIILFFGQSQPGLVLVAILVGMSLFFVADAVVSVPWFDVIARGIPGTRRGRVMGSAQVLGGLGGTWRGLPCVLS